MVFTDVLDTGELVANNDEDPADVAFDDVGSVLVPIEPVSDFEPNDVCAGPSIELPLDLVEMGVGSLFTGPSIAHLGHEFFTLKDLNAI